MFLLRAKAWKLIWTFAHSERREMEKFYIVSNKNFLAACKFYTESCKARSEVIKVFFAKYGISGNSYMITGDGAVNKPFEDYGKKNINLYIEENSNNIEKFGSQLKKAVKSADGKYFCPFRKNLNILKEFQQECIDRHLVINLEDVKEWDYFKEFHYGGCHISRFEYNGKCYLQISGNTESITPEYEGFTEIKGSEFYMALEEFEKGEESNE